MLLFGKGKQIFDRKIRGGWRKKGEREAKK